jgi:hypothetical protein
VRHQLNIETFSTQTLLDSISTDEAWSSRRPIGAGKLGTIEMAKTNKAQLWAECWANGERLADNVLRQVRETGSPLPLMKMVRSLSQGGDWEPDDVAFYTRLASALVRS